jgi:ubiquitin-conjugating enzyme E2 G1
MLGEPNINSPENLDAAIMFRDDYESYRKKVRRLANDSMDYL